MIEALLTPTSLLLFCSAVTFGLWFGLTEPWRKHAFGRSVMWMTAGVAILSGLGLLRHIFGDDYAARETLIVVGRLMVTGAILSRFAVLVREQRKDRAPRGQRRHTSRS